MNYLIATAGEKAGLGHVHPHMLRHSCGYALADKGTDLRTMQDYLGHRDPAMTVRYSLPIRSRSLGTVCEAGESARAIAKEWGVAHTNGGSRGGLNHAKTPSNYVFMA